MRENATDKSAHLDKLEFQFISPHSVVTRMAQFSPLALCPLLFLINHIRHGPLRASHLPADDWGLAQQLRG